MKPKMNQINTWNQKTLKAEKALKHLLNQFLNTIHGNVEARSKLVKNSFTSRRIQVGTLCMNFLRGSRKTTWIHSEKVVKTVSKRTNRVSMASSRATKADEIQER